MNHSFEVSEAEKYGVELAILIQNFRFWILKNRANGNNFYENRTWTYNTAAAFAELFPYWNEKKIYRLLSKGVDRGIWIKGSWSDNPYDRTNWFAFVDESQFLPDRTPENGDDKNEKSHFPEKENVISAKEEREFPKMGNVYTDVNNTDNKPYSKPDTQARACAKNWTEAEKVILAWVEKNKDDTQLKMERIKYDKIRAAPIEEVIKILCEQNQDNFMLLSDPVKFYHQKIYSFLRMQMTIALREEKKNARNGKGKPGIDPKRRALVDAILSNPRGFTGKS